MSGSRRRPVTVGVVVVSYNSARDLRACLDSLAAAATPDTRLEVVVVDNASTDGSADLVRRHSPSVRVIDAGGNLGFARAVNLGAAAVPGDHVLLLNPDAVLLPGALEALVTFAEEHPDHGLYGGRVLEEDGSTDPSSCWGDMTVRSLLCFATGLSTAFPRNPVLDPESLGRWQRDDVREVPVVTGCLLLVRRDAWEALGGMDETYWLYGEDADFSLRARQHGLRPVVVPDARIRHVKGASSPGGTKMSLVLAGRATLIRRRWRPAARAAGLGLLTAGVGLRALLTRAARRQNPTWPAAWETRALWRRGYPGAMALVGSPDPGAVGSAR